MAKSNNNPNPAHFFGITIVTDICLTGSEKLVRIPLTQYFPQRDYGLVLRKGRFLSPQARRQNPPR